ncbi:MAG TPA: hypothetical protein VFX97_17040 [Pyrinomonadaceae bacterium]|nr:hypothetical protein [Pyrinomonadaceae bacterium]
MKKAVESYFVVPPRPSIRLYIPANEKKGTLACIDAIQNLFGKGGKYWIKGDEKIEKDGINKFCLVGAAKETNGQYENAARAAISLAVAQMFPKKFDLTEDEVEDNLAYEGTITDFNDDKKTSWKKVLEVLKTARKLVREA